MQHLILHDDPERRAHLLPLTYTRPVAALRAGVDTLAQKWERLAQVRCHCLTGVDYLDEIFSDADTVLLNAEDTLHVASDIIADMGIVRVLTALRPGEALTAPDGTEIGRRGPAKTAEVRYDGTYKSLSHLYDIFLLNGECIEADIASITSGRRSMPLSGTNTIIGDPSKVFIEEGADVEGVFINTRGGSVYIGRDAVVMEGSMLRGPLALCEHSTVNMGTKIYGATTIGPHCKVGGELNNVVMLSYSNKAHDGFLGNAIIGEWCNLGAGCVASNLKNDYTTIKLWNYPAARFLKTGLQFCGLIMGDHSKAGINTMFNTATVVGVGVNIHGSGFPRNFVASFSEGSTAGYTDVSMTKFFETASRMMARRSKELTEADKRMFYAIRAAAEAYK